MAGHDPEIEELRDKVHCAVVLELTPPPWRLDRKESTKLSLKYRRGKGEILIVSHAGRGWWDPTSDAKGDVFGLVQKLDPGLSFGHVRKRLREFAGLSPSFPPADRAGRHNDPDKPVAERLAQLADLALSHAAARGPRGGHRGRLRGGRVAGRAGRERLVRASRCRRRRRPCRCARADVQRFADWRDQVAVPLTPGGPSASEADSRRGCH